MNKITKSLKEHLVTLETVEERLSYLKGKYSNRKAVILAPGPSLNDYDLSVLNDRDDIVLIAIKQAYDKIKGQTDFHVVNTYNFDKYNGYDYEHLDSVIFYGLSQSYIKEQMEKLAIKPHPVDMWVPIVNPPTIGYEDTIHKSADFDKFFMLEKETKSTWGTSILYEQAIPLALLLGCKDMVTIGWDLGTGNHSYDDKAVKFKVNTPEVQYTNDAINTTPQLFDWLEVHKLSLSICSSSNPADSRFNRIEPWQI